MLVKLHNTPIAVNEPDHILARGMMWSLFGAKAIALPLMWIWFSRSDACFYALGLWANDGSAKRDVFVTPPFNRASSCARICSNSFITWSDQLCCKKRTQTTDDRERELNDDIENIITGSVPFEHVIGREIFIEKKIYRGPPGPAAAPQPGDHIVM